MRVASALPRLATAATAVLLALVQSTPASAGEDAKTFYANKSLRLIVATEYEGVRNALASARRAGFSGRFLYMTSIGVTRRSLSATLLNLVKGNTLRWRRRAEDDIRASGVDYTIIRAGFLLNSPGGRRAIDVSQEAHALSPRYRIARADVAETFVEALKRPSTSRTTFEVVWGRGPRRDTWDLLLGRLKQDA